MATTLTTSYQRIGKNAGSFNYGGYSFTFTVRTYAYYEDLGGNSARFHFKLTVKNDSSWGWTGTNQSYYIRLNGQGVPGVNSDAHGTGAGEERTIWEGTWDGAKNTEYSLVASYYIGAVSMGIDVPGGSGTSGSVIVPPSYSPPTGLSTQLREVYPNGAKIYVSVSSYGNPSSASGRYVEAAILSSNNYGAEPRRYLAAYNISSSNIVVNNTSAGTLTIQPNTQYYYGGFANNTQRNVSTVSGQLVTAPPTPTVSLGTVKSGVITVDYSIPADGGFYTKTFQYSIDGGTTWETVGTIPSTATTGSFTINGLTPNTSYTIKTRTSTTAANTYGTDLTFVTPNGAPLYGSVNSEATKIDRLYGSVNGQTKLITKLYGSVNGETKRIF